MASQSNPVWIFFGFLRKASRSQRLMRLRSGAFFATPLRMEQANRLIPRPLGNTLRSRTSPRRFFPSLSKR